MKSKTRRSALAAIVLMIGWGIISVAWVEIPDSAWATGVKIPLALAALALPSAVVAFFVERGTTKIG